MIRHATADDTAALESLYADVMRNADWRAAREVESFAEVSAGEVVWVFEASGRIVGLLSVWEPDRFVHHLYVHPDAQGRGVGSALLASLESWLAIPWRLKCAVANTRARAFYKARGWREIGRGDGQDGPYALLESV